MNRNIVTIDDAIAARRKVETENAVRSGTPLRKGEPAPMGGGHGRQHTDIRPDDWLQRLAKYIPSEAIGLYLAIAGVIPRSDATGGNGLWWLGAVLLVSLLFNTLFLRRIWQVQRWFQIAVSNVALLVYAFAAGGTLIQQLPFYRESFGTLALVVTTAFLAFVSPPTRSP